MAYEEEKKLERLQVRDEEASHELSIAQKRALIAEAKRRYGNDWKQVFSKMTKGDWFKFSEELKTSVIPRMNRM
jgi:hypothetical protein